MDTLTTSILFLNYSLTSPPTHSPAAAACCLLTLGRQEDRSPAEYHRCQRESIWQCCFRVVLCSEISLLLNTAERRQRSHFKSSTLCITGYTSTSTLVTYTVIMGNNSVCVQASFKFIHRLIFLLLIYIFISMTR